MKTYRTCIKCLKANVIEIPSKSSEWKCKFCGKINVLPLVYVERKPKIRG